jgi:hypothetical protein
LLEKPITGMPLDRPTAPTAVTSSDLSGPRISLAPDVTAALAAAVAPATVPPVSRRLMVMFSAILGLASMKPMASRLALASDWPTPAMPGSPVSGSSRVTCTGPRPKLWAGPLGMTGASWLGMGWAVEPLPPPKSRVREPNCIGEQAARPSIAMAMRARAVP